MSSETGSEMNPAIGSEASSGIMLWNEFYNQALKLAQQSGSEMNSAIKF